MYNYSREKSDNLQSNLLNKFLTYFHIEDSSKSNTEKQNSALAMSRFFSKYDKVVESKLKNVDISAMNNNPRSTLGGNDRGHKSSISSYSKPYSRRKIVLNRDKSSRGE